MSSKRGRVNQYERHVGSHHRVYGLTSPDGSGKIVYSIGWIEKCRLDSFIEIYLRDGNSLHDVNSMTPSYESPELAEVRRRLILDYDNFKSKSHDQFVYKLSIVECFYLELLPQSDFAIYIIKLRSRLILGEDGIFNRNPVCEYIPFAPIKEIELIAFIQYLITPKDIQTAFNVFGRGVGYKSLEGFITVIRKLERDL